MLCWRIQRILASDPAGSGVESQEVGTGRDSGEKEGMSEGLVFREHALWPVVGPGVCNNSFVCRC